MQKITIKTTHRQSHTMHVIPLLKTILTFNRALTEKKSTLIVHVFKKGPVIRIKLHNYMTLLFTNL